MDQIACSKSRWEKVTQFCAWIQQHLYLKSTRYNLTIHTVTLFSYNANLHCNTHHCQSNNAQWIKVNIFTVTQKSRVKKQLPGRQRDQYAENCAVDPTTWRTALSDNNTRINSRLLITIHTDTRQTQLIYKTITRRKQLETATSARRAHADRPQRLFLVKVKYTSFATMQMMCI